MKFSHSINMKRVSLKWTPTLPHTHTSTTDLHTVRICKMQCYMHVIDLCVYVGFNMETTRSLVRIERAMKFHTVSVENSKVIGWCGWRQHLIKLWFYISMYGNAWISPEVCVMLKVNNINFSFISKICEAGELQVQTIMPLKSIKYPSNAFPWLPTTSDNLKPQNCCLRANSTYEIKLLHRSRAKVREWVRARSCNGNAISTELSMISATSERPQRVSERARIFNFHKKKYWLRPHSIICYKVKIDEYLHTLKEQANKFTLGNEFKFRSAEQSEREESDRVISNN